MKQIFCEVLCSYFEGLLDVNISIFYQEKTAKKRSSKLFYNIFWHLIIAAEKNKNHKAFNRPQSTAAPAQQQNC